MLKVLKLGLHTSIQDSGRFGYRHFGIPLSGVMDSDSAKLSNIILGNSEKESVMEITLQGPTLEFLNATQIAICGADLSATINKEAIEMNAGITIRKGDILQFGKRKNGVRSYMSVLGGFQTEIIYESRSFYGGITKKEKIENGDIISFFSNLKPGYSATIQPEKKDINTNQINVYPGPEFNMLSETEKNNLLNTSFTLGLNNRMAYQLRELLVNELPSIISSSILPGTVQLTPSGKILILMRDCQTAGGYPRILQLAEASINNLSQKMQGETIQFKFIEYQ